MKIFISKIFWFLFVLFSIILTILVANRYFANFKSPDQNTTLVAGNSHSSCSVNDSLIPGLMNRSNPGEAYFYTYYKTRELLKQNPDINNLLIEFSNDQLDYEMMSRWIWGDQFILYNFPKYGVFMDGEAYRLLNSNNPIVFVKGFSNMLRENFRMLFKRLDYNKNDIGGYTRLEGSNVTQKIALIDSRKQRYKMETFAFDNLRYLEKIIVFARSRGVHVYLMRSPVHAQSLAYENLDNEEVLQQEAIRLKNKYPGLEFFDFSDLPMDNNEFKDLDHLNYKGANRFSNWLSTLIQNGLFDKVDKSDFVKLEMRRMQEESKE